MRFDYIVVGAGAAGCVVANRLSADPRNRVLLIEYGGRGRNPMLTVPKGFYFTLRGDRYTYRYPTRPVGPGGRVETWTRGKVSGGSTAVNAMLYTRGAPADYDAIVARGNPGWGWDDILPAYRAMEDHQLGPSPLRGTGGPYGVSVTETDSELTEAIFASAQKVGWRRAQDTNEDDDERIGFTPSSIRNGLRVSAFTAFLRPILHRPNLTYLTRTRAGYLLVDGTRVTGVRTRTTSSYADHEASREVILCAGTVESTLLMERSGIGRRDVLHRIGVDVVAESPHLGERVLEQRTVRFQVRTNGALGQNPRLNTPPKQAWEGLKYLATRRGPLATGGLDLLCAFKSSPELSRPDIQGNWMPLALDVSASSMKLAKHAGFMFTGYQVRPTTESSVHAGGARPDDPPRIDARYLETELDRAATSSILRIAREVVNQSPLADLVEAEEFPGPDLSSPQQVIDYAMATGAGIHHAVGAAAMGPADDDVVDATLRVRGVTGLRVVDASVFREQPSGNTAAPTMALAWRACDLIHAEARH